jgi:hypothetical protein
MFGWSNALLKTMPRHRALSRNRSEPTVMSDQHVDRQYNIPSETEADRVRLTPALRQELIGGRAFPKLNL